MLGGFDFYNFITSSEGKEIVVNGWKTAGIYDALELGRKKLPSIDPFQDIDPLVIGSNVDTNVSAVCQLEQREIETICHSNVVNNYDDVEEWEKWKIQDTLLTYSMILTTNNLCNCLLMQIQMCLKLILVNFLLKNPLFPKKIPYKIFQKVFIRESLFHKILSKKFREFFTSRKFLPRKFLRLK